MSTFRKKVLLTGLVIALLSVGACAWVYRYIKSGGLQAQQTPSKIETLVAQGLVELSVPGEMKNLTNPASALPDSADVAKGRDLYQKYCSSCHNYDGSGKTAAGTGFAIDGERRRSSLDEYLARKPDRLPDPDEEPN